MKKVRHLRIFNNCAEIHVLYESKPLQSFKISVLLPSIYFSKTFQPVKSGKVLCGLHVLP